MNFEINNEEIFNSDKTVFWKKDKEKKRQKLKSSKNGISTYYSIYKQGNIF